MTFSLNSTPRSLVKYNDQSLSAITEVGSTVAGGNMVFIKELTASSSATLSFVNGASDVVLDSTYPIYVFKFINMHPATDVAEFQFNMSVDSGSNYNVTKTTTLWKARLREDNAIQELGYESGSDLAQSTNFQSFTYAGIRNDNDASLNGTLHIFSPSSTTFVKHFISECNYMSKSGPTSVTYNSFIAGYGNTTSAVDAVQFKMSSGNTDAGTIKLYGLKDS